MADEPLILTLALDSLTQQRFERERRQYFPAARNHIPAHVSMFQSLPGAELDTIAVRLEALRGRAELAVQVVGVRSLGRGCAYDLRSATLDGLRAELARGWAGWLGAQDRQGYRAHVTVQNKVATDVARDTLARLQAGFMPWDAQGVGRDAVALSRRALGADRARGVRGRAGRLTRRAAGVLSAARRPLLARRGRPGAGAG